MKKIIKPTKEEVAEYVCDICGKQIGNGDSFDCLDRVNIVTYEAHGNGWVGIEKIEQVTYHAHKKCLQTVINLMKGNGNQ